MCTNNLNKQNEMQLQLNAKQTVFAFTYSDEFTESTWETKELDDNDDNLSPYTEIIKLSDSPEELLAKLQKFIGEPDRCIYDDDFFDYIPSAIDTALQFAAAHGEDIFNYFFKTLRENETLNKNYMDDEEETLHGYLKYDQDIKDIDIHSHYEKYLEISEMANRLFNK